MEPFQIRSETLPIFNSCMCDYHFIFHLNSSYSHIFTTFIIILSFTHLMFSFLYSNQLSGTVPTCIGNLSSLVNLKLYYNQLTGSIPLEICNLSHLQFLYLNYNQLNGTIPSCIGNLTNLLNLYLSKNEPTGVIPSAIGSFNTRISPRTNSMVRFLQSLAI